MAAPRPFSNAWPRIARSAACRAISSPGSWQTGAVETLEPGVVLTPSTGPVKGLYIVLDGHLLIRVDRGAGPRIVMEWHGGDVTGMLPYSRIKAPPGNVSRKSARRCS